MAMAMATNSGIVRLWAQFGDLFKLVDTITVEEGVSYTLAPGDYNVMNDRKLVLVDAPFWRAGTMPGTWKMEAD
jgi:hypothetical protein